MRKEKNGISVHAIPGTHTVLFGMDASEEARKGLLGFALGKRKPSGNIAWMNGFKVFEATSPNPEPGTLKPTNEHPIQDFQWSDYNAEPGGEAAAYVIRPLYGTPTELVPGADIEMTVATLNAPGARHHVVRRQMIWLRLRVRVAECLARRGVDVMRRSCGAASGDVRWSVA